MSELIKLYAGQFSEEGVPTVNARELHAFLEVGRHYRTWIADRIVQFDFLENIDYVIVAGTGNFDPENPKSRIQSTREYFLSLDMAKELSMIERNEKGREARRYFIECERRLKEVETPEQMVAKGLIAAHKLLEQKNALIAEMAPKAEALDRIATATGSIPISSAAKDLQVRPKILFDFLKEHRWIYRRGDAWVAYQDKIGQGLLEHKVSAIRSGKGEDKLVDQARVTAKGLAKLAEMLKVPQMSLFR